jgi:hypothetical protein
MRFVSKAPRTSGRRNRLLMGSGRLQGKDMEFKGSVLDLSLHKWLLGAFLGNRKKEMMMRKEAERGKERPLYS